MTYFIDRVRLLIEQNEVNQATDQLLTVLKNGSKEILDRATLMSPSRGKNPQRKRRRIPKITRPEQPSNLTLFLSELEEDEPQLVKFLTEIEIAEQKNTTGDWQGTKQHLESALAIHDDSFNLSREDIIQQIKVCENAISYNKLIAQGNREFLTQNWQSALTAYKRAIDVLDRDFNIDKVKEQISICERGIRFEEYLQLAKLAKSKRKWVQARDYFNEALTLNLIKYYPEALSRSITEDLRKCTLKSQKRGSLTSGFPFTMKKTGTSPLLLIGILAFLALSIYYPELSLLIDQAFSENSKATQNEILVASDSLADELVVEKVAVILADTLSIDTIASAINTDLPEPEPHKEENSYGGDPQLDLVPDINDAPTPGQIRQMLKPKTISKDELTEVEAAKPEVEEEEAFTYEAGRIAIIPFCHEGKDKNLAKRVYMDASFAIRTAGKANQSAVSRSLVQGVIKKLQLSKNNFCSETGATEIARSLHAENVLIGSISHLPNDQIRIVCEILHVPSLRYSGEIVLTDRNSDRLRNKLKQEIQQVFN